MVLTDEYPIKSPSVLPGCTGSIILGQCIQDDAGSIILGECIQGDAAIASRNTDGDLIGYSSVNSICRRPS